MRELLLGISLGFSAGISPGPLLTLVLTTTLRHGFLSGVRVAASPLITDGPIIFICVLVISSLPAAVATALTLGGAAFLVFLGIETLRGAPRATLQSAAVQPGRDLLRGAMVNILSPHPWLFWLAVGGPIVTDAWELHPARSGAFLLGFFGLLIGSKVALAGAAAAGRAKLTDSGYQRLLIIAGSLLLLSGVLLAIHDLKS